MKKSTMKTLILGSLAVLLIGSALGQSDVFNDVFSNDAAVQSDIVDQPAVVTQTDVVLESHVPDRAVVTKQESVQPVVTEQKSVQTVVTDQKPIQTGETDQKPVQSQPIHATKMIPDQNIQYKTNLNVIQIIQRVFPIFYTYIVKAGYAAAIEDSNNITVFAPTDAAFLKLQNLIGIESFDSIFNNTSSERGMQKLINVLNLHILPNKVLETELRHLESIQPYAGRKLEIHTVDGKLRINNSANTVGADIIGTNGIVHAIDAVIM